MAASTPSSADCSGTCRWRATSGSASASSELGREMAGLDRRQPQAGKPGQPRRAAAPGRPDRGRSPGRARRRRRCRRARSRRSRPRSPPAPARRRRRREAPGPAPHEPHRAVRAAPGAAVLHLQREAGAIARAARAAPPRAGAIGADRRRRSSVAGERRPALRAGLEHATCHGLDAGRPAGLGRRQGKARAGELLRAQRRGAAGDHHRPAVGGQAPGELARRAFGLAGHAAGEHDLHVGLGRVGDRPAAAARPGWPAPPRCRPGSPCSRRRRRGRAAAGLRRSPRRLRRLEHDADPLALRVDVAPAVAAEGRQRPAPPARRAGRRARRCAGAPGRRPAPPRSATPRATIGVSAMLATTTSASGQLDGRVGDVGPEQQRPQAVATGVLFGDDERRGVVVEGEHRRESQPHGGQRQHARAGARVEQRRRAAGRRAP